ncbi:hypothetical protein HYH03_007018 [Edaphochlamys debaryana]|uniref:PAS domain-containing protein n=1 Tax=Edaphochlamys debaryana TaxID=47281 RepID=A0A835Y3Z3_9CHLO|nr:hypothetical protein HYH03_007018 [Edaphochlamys debaryana]|eukprot:KAG2494774.1 hypothetical protein HYH03_007018 [Edaphochlamys debaryana]
MYTLVRQSALSSWKFAVLKIVLEFLMNFVVAFNPSVEAFKVDTSNPAWQVIRWVLWRSPIIRLYGYDMYVVVMYVQAVIVVAAVAGLLWLTLAMRRTEQSRFLKHFAVALHILYDVTFVMCYVSVFDYFTFAVSCHFEDEGRPHTYFTNVECLGMPHVIHMLIALTMAAVVLVVTALMVIASCDLNPVSKGYLASPAAYARLKILIAKAAYIIFANCFESQFKLQTLGQAVAVTLVVWWNFRRMPFYRKAVNAVWTGVWCGVLLPVLLQLIAAWGDTEETMTQAAREERTQWVLYGIFPTIMGGALVTATYNWWYMRPAQKFLSPAPGAKLSTIHKFDSPDSVEKLSRVMRAFDEDGLVEADAAAHGETIIKAGMQIFPGKPHLMILYSNFILEVKKDGPSARTHLQLASKASPNLVQRYQIYCTQEASKRLKDSQDGGMDLQAYIEFKRNFRAVLRVHKEVLLMQADLWQLCMRSTLKVSALDAAMEALDGAASRANQVYKRVLERYPNNGKLLRCYGKFLEGVRHDPVAAARAYGEANRQGGANAMLALDLSAVQAADKPEFLTSMSMDDDAVIVIDSVGTIMMVSQAVQKVFGHSKLELEGANVSLLMPQPFSQRHASYLQRYVGGGEPHILDTVREVVALHKERFVFPVMLCVTKLSGMGSDSVFLGVIRPMPPSSINLRAWIAPNGVLLCADQQFASAVGATEGELVGRTLDSMVTQPLKAEGLLQRCREASAGELSAGLQADLQFHHRYLDPVHVHVTVHLAGTDGQRLLVLNFRRADGQDGSMLVCDTHMHIRFASADLAVMLGYSMRKLNAMRLDQLLPPPYNTLHARWVKDPPHTVQPYGCRAGVVVQLVTEAGGQVPVKIKVRTSDMSGSTALHIVQVSKAAAEEMLDARRLHATLDFAGRVLAVSDPSSLAFDFPAHLLLGRSVADFVDVFGDWAEDGNDLQMLLLALLAKEQELPGMSWRMRVLEPVHEGEEKLPVVTGAQSLAGARGRVSRSACVQVEMEEDDGEAGGGEAASAAGTRIRLTLWRRDLMSGVLELDEDLVIRKASFLTGLITGVPSPFMHRKPLSRFLDVPEGATWDQLLSAAGPNSKQKSALKAAPLRPTVSPVLMYLGPHPDSGTMRLRIQGVHVPAPNGRAKIIATLHPDTSYTGAHVDLVRVLKLDDLAASVHGDGQGERHGNRSGRAASHPPPKGRRGDSAAVGEDLAMGGGSKSERGDEDAASDAGVSAVGSAEGDQQDRGQRAEAGGGGRGGPPTSLHRTTTNKSEFTEQWVRTLSKQVSGDASASAGGKPGEPQASAPGGGGDKAEAEAAAHGEGGGGGGTARAPSKLELASKSLLAPIPEDQDGAVLKAPLGKAAGAQRRAFSTISGAPEGRDVGTPESMASRANKRRDHGGPPPEEDEANDKASESGESSADGSQAASAYSAATSDADVNEVVIDARRGRLLKALHKTVLGPSIATPMDRLRLHSYACVAVMLVVHIVAYVIITSLTAAEHSNVYLVHRQAMAMDRSQLILVRVVLGTFCERANVTAKVSVCANPLNYTLARLHTNIQLMEEYHQAVYLGLSQTATVKPKSEVYDIYTKPHLNYHIYLDTHPPKVMTAQAGAWQLGNRYIAAAREAVGLTPKLLDTYRLHRSFSFLLTNGLGPLFEGYSNALDHLVSTAWDSILELRRDLTVLLVVEALVVQIACTGYLLFLVHSLECARILPFLAMLGLPGPILRQMSSVDVKIAEGSSDDDDDDASEAGEERDGPKAIAARQPPAQARLMPAPGPDGAAAAAAAGSGLPNGTAPPKRVATIDDGAPGNGGDPPDAEEKAEEVKPGRVAEADANSLNDETSADELGLGQAQRGGAPLRMQGSKRAQASGGRGHGSTRWRINGKTLTPSHASVSKFLVPLFVWNAAVIVIYAISLFKLDGMQAPLASLNMASHVTYRYTRIRAIAAAFVTQDSREQRDVWRPMLERELAVFESEYDALMYGGFPSSMADSTFQHEVPASTFASAAFARNFFRLKECMRYDKSTCLQPGHQFYEATHNGLDAMVRRTIMEIRLLYLDADEDVSYDNARYGYMAVVAGNDLYEGLQQAAQLFIDYSISRYDEVTELHTILLVVACGLAVSYFLFLLYPHLRKARRDATWQGSLLSLAPPEMDVRAHVRTVYRRAARSGGQRVSGIKVA